ncbi:hypothetical protein [Actinomadura sp. 3N508]|uniref:hypothetical protein n=1 Tax=Actinomadura sp. 3N508 TaxID=3375153 RepID=UPI0037993B0F
MPLRAELLISREVSEERQRDIVGDLTGFELDVRIRRPIDSRGLGDTEWVLLLSLPLQAFLAGFGSVVAEDFYDGMKRLAGRVRRREDGEAADPRPMVLHDRETELEIVLEPDLPVAAYAQLFELDLSGFQSGPLHFDRARGCWRSVSDEIVG